MKKKLLSVIALFVITSSFCHAQTFWGFAAAGNASNSGDYYIFKTNDTGKVKYEHQFGSGKDGLTPEVALMKASNGLLYGVTSEGGTIGIGTIFSYNISTGSYGVVYNFMGYPSDGGFPDGPLIQASDGLLYGITTNGGTYQYGTIYNYNTMTGIETDVYNFSGGDTDGFYPQTEGLIQVGDSLLYGTTETGGADTSGGIIFTYNIYTHKETVVYNFVTGRGVGTGNNPVTSLFQVSDGLLYGATESGGSNGTGELFSYNISTHSYSDLYDFGGATTNAYGSGSLIQVSDSLLYGLAAGGGNNYRGLIFSYNIYSKGYKDVHDFGNNTDGQSPYGALLKASNGLLYGLTQEGGVNGQGTIFSFNDTTNNETDIHDFAFTDTAGDNPDGNLIEDDSFVVANTPVWPGDANDDLTVNVYDLLSLGLYYNKTGPARDTVTNTWAPHPAKNWGALQYSGYDLKYADCNGDGIINIGDLPTIILNYGLTHPFHSPRGSYNERSGGVPLYFIADSTLYHGGSNVHVSVWLGNSSNQATNIYGLGYYIDIDTTLIESGTLTFNSDSSFIGTIKDTSALSLTYIGNDVETAVVGTDHTNKSGYGKIGDLYFTLSSLINNPQFLISVSDWLAVDTGGNTLTIQPAGDTLKVTTGIHQLSANSEQLLIYPNPCNGNFIVENNNVPGSKYILFDLLGRQLSSGNLLSQKTNFDFSYLAEGNYILNIYSRSAATYKEITIIK